MMLSRRSHDHNPSRRSALGFLGAVPLAAGGLLAAQGTAEANADLSSGSGRIPKDLRPGGAFDQHIKELADKDQFSGTVMIAHRGRQVLARAYGWADKEGKVPNKIDTIYALASTSKPFTGLAVVQLVQQGKLKFYDLVSKHLNGLPAGMAERITVHHLLTHTSGLGDARRAGEQPPPEKIHNSYEEQVADFWANLKTFELEFAPGTKKAYSSMGYTLLGELVAKVSGTSFQDYVRQNVFVPAGMKDSAYYDRRQWLADKRIAHPYMYQKDGTRVDAVRNLDKGSVYGDAGQGSNSARGWMGTGGGNGFSTAPDLVRFAVALQGGKLTARPYTELYVNGKISAKPLRENTSGSSLRGETFQAYGPVAATYNNQRIVTHGGGAGGISTSWSVYLDMDWTAVILSNYDLQSIEPIIDLERRLITGA
ncbi:MULTISPECIES: serine hydrolase domain-containing protein [unclassified Streptosporangium]|uniref:serine hydrolase domain-containing protein n=1 Tax=unclassified Streptosporangium TaxID=2632669 RepID=UPI002E2CF712|nr:MULTISPECIES: serine hydrolase domain-containing protein [unclassified Streptosporangium]